MGDVKYLLSPQDLMAVEMVPSLIDAGVGCFKIEGRLKGPEYVALTVSVYRRALDEAWAARETRLERSSPAEPDSERGKKAGPAEDWHLPASDRVDLAQVPGARRRRARWPDPRVPGGRQAPDACAGAGRGTAGRCSAR